MVIDWSTTHRNVVNLLIKALKPLHYKGVFDQTVEWSGASRYSAKTDPVEKFRQYYADQDHDDVIFIPGGYLALRRWFPFGDQLSLFSPDQWVTIKGDCIVSYESGYEYCKREPHLKDWFGDARTLERHARRQRAFLTEAHVRHYFQTNYSAFYRPPSNEGIYDQPDGGVDFSLQPMPNRLLKVDVKTISYREDGDDVSVIRSPRSDVLYLFCDWEGTDRSSMRGIAAGGWLRAMGERNGGLTHISHKHTVSVEALLVDLNMAKTGKSYIQFRESLLKRELSLGA